MNRTQQLSWNTIDPILTGEALLLEALLRRGFLAYCDTDGVWLGIGSHAADIAALGFIGGILIEPVQGHPDRVCRVAFAGEKRGMQHDAARHIVGLPEHHVGNELGGWTTFGPAPRLTATWARYCGMRWGAKLPVCPAYSIVEPKVDTALDTGVALLVKALPLARIATSLSCDGHGTREAYVSFHYPWDAAWFSVVFDWLPFKPAYSSWNISGRLTISPKGGYDDEAIIAMLNDIQMWSRQLLDRKVIDRLGVVRDEAIQRLQHYRNGPSPTLFYQEARARLCEPQRIDDFEPLVLRPHLNKCR